MNKLDEKRMSHQSRLVWKKLQKLNQRIQRKITKGSFYKLSRKKQAQLLKTYRRYTQRLELVGLTFKNTVIAGSLVFSLAMGNTAQAQIFTEQTGVNNPFNGVDIGNYSKPAFVDIDNDGDFDAFIGESSGIIKYYKNTGTNLVPVFAEETGGNNPFDGKSLGGGTAPTFIDIDNDGDFDAFIGEGSGIINYYKNIGTNLVPVFAKETGGNNPFDGESVPYISAPTFADIDNDGDFDAFIGEYNGIINHYKNTGTNLVPVFAKQTGGNNLFDGLSASYASIPTFADIDNDGDFDAFSGDGDGIINYYKNTGTNVAPVLAAQTGANNPFNGVDIGSYSTPTFVDIDNDGDFDAFIGESTGIIKFYKNTTVLPVELTSFTALGQENQTNLLQWKTATEKNNDGFEVERSMNGQEWETLDFVKGNGTTLETQNYTYIDEAPLERVSYYRLKQIDLDGQFEYSEIVSVEAKDLGNDDVMIYPNPVQDRLTIGGEFAIENVVIYNSLGQTVRQISNLKSQRFINVSDLPRGQYMLSIQKENGIITTKLFVK